MAKRKRIAKRIKRVTVWQSTFNGKPCGDWYFHGQAGNGRIVEVSEGYTSKAACLRMARRLAKDHGAELVVKDQSD